MKGLLLLASFIILWNGGGTVPDVDNPNQKGVDMREYWANRPKRAPLVPTWAPPGGESYAEFISRNGFKPEVFTEVKSLLAELMINAGVPEDIANNNNGRLEDEILTPVQLQAMIELKKGRRKKRSVMINMDIYGGNKWTFPIKYMFDGTHTTAEMAYIREGFQFWADNTCASFQEFTVAPTEQYNLITNGPGCYSYVGKVPTTAAFPQIINYQYDGCLVDGIILHEMGHMLGVYHEQSRPDRDSYVSVTLSNVQAGKEHNFDMKPASVVTMYSSPYDYNSVMHYGRYGFAVDSSIETLTPLNPIYSIGQRAYPSFWDIRGINQAYCSAICPSPLACQNGGYTDPNDCSKCKCPEGLGGTLCETVAAGGPACSPAPSAVLTATTSAALISSPGYLSSVDYTQGTGNLCNFIIEAPVGCTIDVQFTFGPSTMSFTSKTCIHWVELKYKADLSLPGPRVCGSSLLSPNMLTSESNKMVVIFNAELPYLPSSTFPPNTFSKPGFELSYQISDPSCASACGPSWTSSWSTWSPCSFPCGGCGVQRRGRCNAATGLPIYEHRRCNICPCRKGIDPVKMVFWRGKYGYRSNARCCNDFIGTSVKPNVRPERPRPCIRRQTRGWYAGTYNKAAICKVSSAWPGHGPFAYGRGRQSLPPYP